MTKVVGRRIDILSESRTGVIYTFLSTIPAPFPLAVVAPWMQYLQRLMLVDGKVPYPRPESSFQTHAYI